MKPDRNAFSFAPRTSNLTEMLTTLWFVMALSFSAFSAQNEPALKSFNGVWNPVKAELGGKPMPEQVLKSITLKLENGHYEVTVTGAPQTDKGTFVLDSSNGKNAMKVNGVEGPNAGKMFPAIYELQKDTLRICYDLSGKKTPEAFATTTNTLLYLVTYHRAAAEGREPPSEKVK